MSAEAIELRRIRSKLSALDGAQWFRSTDERGEFVEAKTRNGELNEIARFHAGAQPEEIDFIVSAPEMVAFLLKLVDRAISKARQTSGTQRQGDKRTDFARDAGIKCGNAAFQVFVEEQHGLERPLTADRAAQKLRSILGISSRSKLNSDGAAADRWQRLLRDFYAWRKAGR